MYQHVERRFVASWAVGTQGPQNSCLSFTRTMRHMYHCTVVSMALMKANNTARHRPHQILVPQEALDLLCLGGRLNHHNCRLGVRYHRLCGTAPGGCPRTAAAAGPPCCRRGTTRQRPPCHDPWAGTGRKQQEAASPPHAAVQPYLALKGHYDRATGCRCYCRTRCSLQLMCVLV